MGQERDARTLRGRQTAGLADADASPIADPAGGAAAGAASADVLPVDVPVDTPDVVLGSGWEAARLPRRTAPHVFAWVVAIAVVAGLAWREGSQEAIYAGGAFLLAWGLLAWLVPALHRLDLVDRPGGRALHPHAVPRLGGLAVYVPFAIAVFVLALSLEPKLAGLLVGATLVVSVGFVDDVRGVSPRTKIAFQLAAGIALVLAGYRLPALGVPGLGTLQLGWLEVPTILFTVVLITNAFNLVDGMDGLAAGLALVALAGFHSLGVHSLVVLALGGALWGFLPYNLPRARIFLGDTGSLLIGFVLAALLLDLPAYRNVPLTVALLAYPLGDVALATMRRFVRGKPLFTPDQSHIHHKLRYHFRQMDSLAVLTVVVLAGIAAGLGLGRPGIRFLVLMAVLWGLMAVLLVYLGRTGIGLMVKTRRPFRELHLIRVYVLGRLDLAQTPEEVHRDLERLAEDLPLASLEVGDFRWRSERQVEGPLLEDALPLAGQVATWSAEPHPGEQYALTAERRTVVADVLRRAAQRLRAMAASS